MGSLFTFIIGIAVLCIVGQLGRPERPERDDERHERERRARAAADLFWNSGGHRPGR